MRKTIFLFASLLSMLAIQAQIDTEQVVDKKIAFGLRSGYEFQTNTSRLSYRLKLPYIGIWTDLKLNDRWSFQFELNLRSEKRVRVFNSGFKESIDELYLTGPFLLKLHLNETFKIYTGTQVLSASLVSDVSGLKKWNGILGLAYQVAKNIYLDARFRHGFEKQVYRNNFRDNRLGLGVAYQF